MRPRASGAPRRCGFRPPGYAIIATGRRAERLATLEAEIEAAGVAARPFSSTSAPRRRCRHLEPLERVDLLVNNAGLAAGLEHIDRGDTRDWGRHDRHQRQGAALRHTGDRPRRWWPRARGHIVNLGSIAGTEPYENGAVYCASKHAVHAISQSMRADLLSSGIKVTEIRPGMVETEFSRCVSTATGRGQPPFTKGSSP